MSKHPELELTNFVRAIPDFPKPGILFRDITPLLGDPKAFAETIERMADLIRGEKIDLAGASGREHRLAVLLFTDGRIHLKVATIFFC